MAQVTPATTPAKHHHTHPGKLKQKAETNPTAPLYPVLQDGTEEDLLTPTLLTPTSGSHPGSQPEVPGGAQGLSLVTPPHT